MKRDNANIVLQECSDLFPSTTGGAAKMCEEFMIPLLAKLPLDPRLAKV